MYADLSQWNNFPHIVIKDLIPNIDLTLYSTVF